MDVIAANVAEVQTRIGEAARRSGRSAEDVRLVGVTKYVDAETTRRVFDAGCVRLGENRPQSLWEKSDALADLPIQWHMIGNLQRNKVKRTVACCGLIHSVDSVRLAKAIDDAAKELGRVAQVLVEVNVSGETAKHGFEPSELAEVIEALGDFESVEVHGLMCMAGLAGTADDARREFALLRELRDRWAVDTPSNIKLDELSMGMSGDFEVAIEEGATLVRVGSSLFANV